MSSFNYDAGGSGKASEDLTKALELLTENLQKLLKLRYKNNPQKAKAAEDKFLEKFKANALKIQEFERKSNTERILELNDAARELAKMEMASAKNTGEYMKGSLKEAAANFSDYLQKNLSFSAITEKVGTEIENYASMYGKYSAKINARLQTFDSYQGKAFNDLSKLVRKNLAASPYIKLEEMISSLNELVEKGISYNLELRAFLATISDKVVTTFEALDDTLLAMIRLQLMDTTQARMGMEAQLTQYLNSTYLDTSYLSTVYDTTTQNLFEASSQLGRNASIELEYVVQKWLGSMYSVGVGLEFLNKVSLGLGYLGSGNISALQSDAALLNLLVMASNRSGVEYSQILAQGLNADAANKLLQGVTSYIHEISTGSANQVVKSQYAELFGMSLSDMTAMLNIATDEIESIAKGMLTYNDTIKSLDTLLSAVGSRMHLSEMINNVFENFITGVAGNIAGSGGLYVTWKVVDLIERVTGGISIPTIGAFGSFLDLETTATGLMKLGIVGVNVLGQIANIMAGLSTGGSLSLETWSGNESTARGTGFTPIAGYKAPQKTVSTSAFVGSSSGSDIYSSSVTAAKDQAKEENKGQEGEGEDNIIDLTKAIILILEGWSESESINVKVTGYSSSDVVPVQVQDYGLSNISSGLN